MRNRKLILKTLGLIAFAAGIGTCSLSTRSYSAICPRCLQHASSVEKSIFGIKYSRKDVHRSSPRVFEYPDSPDRPLAPVNPGLYEEITGHPCTHVFIRSGHRARQHELRRAITDNLYRAYLRVPEKPLANETLDFIDQLAPISAENNAPPPVMRHPLEAEARPNEPLSILLRGLGLAASAVEWREILIAARAGDGSLDLLQDRDLLIARLDHPDPAVRLQVIDLLAAMNTAEAWAAAAGCLNDPETRKRAANRIVRARYLPLFDAVLEADEKARSPTVRIDPVSHIPEPLRSFVYNLQPEEVRSLLAQQKPRVDLICLAAIRQQDGFEFLDEVVALLNRRPNPAAVLTVETLLEGPDPLGVREIPTSRSSKDPWTAMQADTSMRPVEEMSGLTAGGKDCYRIQQEVVRLGIQRDLTNWPALRERYETWISKWGAEWWSTAFAQAMAESDRQRTLDFLASELSVRDDQLRRATAALAGLGAIGDPQSLAAVKAVRDGDKYGLFGKNTHHGKFLDYALHRCRGIHLWRLEQNADATYSILKSGATPPVPDQKVAD